MVELDKAAMGRRIKQIRLQAGMRQWELARLLGTTQSAVHKYEHGVVPEPRRLVELARIGRTSVEWVLTGQHWENGSEAQERLSPDLLRTAQMLRRIRSDDMPRVDEALRIVRAAVEALRSSDGEENVEIPVDAVRNLSAETLRLIESAWRIEKAVVRSVLGDSAERLVAVPEIEDSARRDGS
jgi:transcriptional regulator with XRE-family HTH domain